MEIAIAVAVVVLGLALLAILLVPSTVEYQETVHIEAPVGRVFDAVRYQGNLMQWSAWPSETGSTCSVENVDGVAGARTVFYNRGKRFGYQEVMAIQPEKSVAIRLESAGPPQKPELTFTFDKAGPNGTLVTLHWHNTIARPFNVLLRVFGIVRWTREMHRKDLAGLKRFCEPPHVTYTGEPARTVFA
jgi:uncharacterized protein YndB with AHSA1/START domain